MTNTKPCRRAGFTLIELLVVVAIIALLISMLLPALNGARRQSKQLKCLTNMKTFGQAVLMYSQTNKSWIVRAESQTLGSLTTTSHFVPSLLPFIGYPELVATFWNQYGQGGSPGFQEVCRKVNLLNCPDFPKEEQILDYVVSSFSVPWIPNGTISSTTGPRPESANFPIGEGPPEFLQLDKLGRGNASELVHMTEAHQEMPLPDDPQLRWGQFTDVFLPNHMAFALFPRVANDQRHPAGITAQYLDGHAEVNTLKQMDPGPPHNRLDRIRRFTILDREGLVPP